MNRYIYCKCIDVVAALLLLAIILVNGFWYFQSDNNVFETGEYEIQSVKAGDIVIFHRDTCIKQGVEIEITRWLTSKDEYIPISSSKYTSIGYCGAVPLRISVPSDIKAGEYQYYAQVVYNLNPLKRAIRTLTPITFRVVE